MSFSSSTTDPPTRYLHQPQPLKICFLKQAWSILSWARVTEFVNLNMQLFFFLVRVKYSLTPKKLLQNVSQLILLGFSVHYNIIKVYQSRTPGKVFFSGWRPRWPPKPLNDHNSVTINSNLMILESIPRFWGGKEDIKTTLDMTKLLNHYEIEFMTFSCPLSPNAETSLSIE